MLRETYETGRKRFPSEDELQQDERRRNDVARSNARFDKLLDGVVALLFRLFERILPPLVDRGRYATLSDLRETFGAWIIGSAKVRLWRRDVVAQCLADTHAVRAQVLGLDLVNSPAMDLLVEIYRNQYSKPVTVSHLTNAVMISPTQCRRLADILGHRGMLHVERQERPGFVAVSLTASGRTAVEAMLDRFLPTHSR